MKLVLQYEAEWRVQEALHSRSGMEWHLLEIGGISAFVTSGEHGLRWRVRALDLTPAEMQEFTGLVADLDRAKAKAEAAIRTYFLNRNELHQ